MFLPISVSLNPHFREQRIDNVFQDPGHAFLKNLQRKLLFKFLPAGLAHVAAQVCHRQILDQNKRNILSPHIATSQTLCDHISRIIVSSHTTPPWSWPSPPKTAPSVSPYSSPTSALAAFCHVPAPL